jgi:hypothetical protein
MPGHHGKLGHKRSFPLKIEFSGSDSPLFCSGLLCNGQIKEPQDKTRKIKYFGHEKRHLTAVCVHSKKTNIKLEIITRPKT